MWHHALRWLFWKNKPTFTDIQVIQWLWLVCGNGKVLDFSVDLLVSEHQRLLLMDCFQQGGWSSNAAERGHRHDVYINWPSGDVKVTRAAKFLVGGAVYYIHTMFCPARTMQGDRCDLTWLRPDHDRRCQSGWDQEWISDDAATRRKYQFFIRCTTSLSRKNSFETRYKNTSCNQSGQITVLTCRERAENHCY